MRNHPPGRHGNVALLYILQTGNLYGTERMALSTLESLDEYSVRATLAPPPSAATSGSFAAATVASGHQSIEFRTKTDLLRKLVPWFIRYRRIDIIGNAVSQSYLCHGLSRLTGVRLRQIHIVHGGTEDQHAYGKKAHLNRLPIRVVAVSDFVKGKLVGFGVDDDSIDVIENFVPDKQLETAARRDSYLTRQPGADGSSVKVAVVSRVDSIKRIEVLVEAVERGGLATFDFDIYGTGDQLNDLRARASALPNIHFHGFVNDIQRRLVQADFLLHLCPSEPFGLAILEAFVHGVVPIVPAAGGTDSIVEDGITGFKFSPDDVGALVATLTRTAATDPLRLQQVAEAGVLRVRSRFSQSKGADAYRASLNKLGPYAR